MHQIIIFLDQTFHSCPPVKIYAHDKVNTFLQLPSEHLREGLFYENQTDEAVKFHW